MNNSKTLSKYAGIVAAVCLLQLAFSLFKEYSSFDIPQVAVSSVKMFVSLLSIVLFASFCRLFSVDANVRAVGFTLFLAFVLEFFGAALSCMPAAKSSYLIIALMAVAPIVSFILLVIGLFKLASMGSESRYFPVATRCYAVVLLLNFAISLAAGLVLGLSAIGSSDAQVDEELLTRFTTVFATVVPAVAACWFYWELGRWISVRWEAHKADYSAS